MLDQELAHRLGPPLRELQIVSITAFGVGVSGDEKDLS